MLHAAGIDQFQSTRPRGARRDQPPGRGLSSVSIHAPTRGATWSKTCIAQGSCFNPRAHAGRDNRRGEEFPPLPVSIHAPTRGATTRGKRVFCSGRFNPRAHAGRDEDPSYQVIQPFVSIHAPTRGATIAARLGSDASPFQSTRPRGARRSRGSAAATSACFNPRAHAGRDQVYLRYCERDKFQSTRPRGARRRGRPARGGRCGFNPRAHAGRDTSRPASGDASTSFNPRAHAGRDAPLHRACLRDCVSIHAPTRGATRTRATTK